MNHVRLILSATALVIAIVPVSSSAQDTDQASGQASARVVRNISAQPQAALAFGAIAVDRQNGGGVVVSARGGATNYTGSVRPTCGATAGCSSHPARFSVTGEPRHGYTIKLPANVFATGSRFGEALEVTSLEAISIGRPEAGGAGHLDDAGRDEFLVGGMLIVPPGATADFYSADLPVLLAYE
ncbi:DUF4402 domain-containing protein [Erythrobacter sp. GH1-10]|uniref:DUF4402 domain-containing protein n=1 Tax=Erythrobacter sp. GH1-10 TaxID=3349334 RepID=UPI0038780694